MHIKRIKALTSVLIGLVCISAMSHPVGAWSWHTDTVHLGSAYGGYFEMRIYKSFWGDEVEGRIYFQNYPYSQTMVIPDGYLGTIRIQCEGCPTNRYQFINEVVDTIKSAKRAYSCAKAVFWCGGGTAVCVTASFIDGPSPAVDYICFSSISYQCASSLFECVTG